MSKYQTEQRQILLELFKSSEHKSFSAVDIFNELKNDDISISAIYRNLKEMESDKLICKVNQKGRSETLYHYVNPKSCIGVIHFKCENCENTYHLNKHISSMISNIAKDEFNFSLNSSGTFLYGKCPKCAQTLSG